MTRWVHFDVTSRAHGPYPGETARRLLTAQLTAYCDAFGVRPVDLVAAEAWRLAAGVVHFRLTVDCVEPAFDRDAEHPSRRSPAAWLAWKHPHWDWSQLPCPVEGLRA